MIFYLKQAFFPIINMLFCSMLGTCVMLLGADLTWLRYVLFCVLFCFYALVIGSATFKDGQVAFKTRNSNDLARRLMIQTGEEHEIKIHEEFKWWKGFLTGAITAIPAVVFVIIHVIIHLSGGADNTFGGIAGMISLPVFGFFMADGVLGVWDYLWVLLVLPYTVAICGIGYYLGGKNIEKQNKIIEEQKRMIYGE